MLHVKPHKSASHSSTALIAALLWLLVVASLLTLTALRLLSAPAFDTSLMALLPDERRDTLLHKAAERLTKGFSNKLVVVLSSASDESAREAVRGLAEALTHSAATARVIWQPDARRYQQFSTFYNDYRFALLDPRARADLVAGDTGALKQRALNAWLGPMGLAAGGADLVNDPFGLAPQGRTITSASINMTPDRGLLRIADSALHRYLLLVDLAGEPFDLRLQQALRSDLDRLGFEQRYPQVSLQLSGLLLHAEAGAQQASNEISTVGLGSLLGIILLMLGVFRSARPLLLVLVSVSIGCLSAAAVTLLVFDRIHLITLAFGAGLVGVSIDYALHLLCDWRETGQARITVRRIFPGLLLGLLSSVLAYGAQSLAPFPGLRQMALFSSVGLIAAWLTVVLWLPYLVGRKSAGPIQAAIRLGAFLDALPRVATHRSAQLLVGFVILFSALGLLGYHSDDDVRLLQTSPPELLQQEQEVQRLLGGYSSARFLLVEAENMERLLQKEERLREGLDSLVAEGLLGGYDALSGQLPSLQRQQQDHQLIQVLYHQALMPLYQTLGLEAALAERASQSLRTHSTQLLKPERWLQHPVSENFRDLLVENSPEQAVSIIRLSGRVDRLRLETVAADEGARLVDRIDNLSQQLGYYRSQIATWVGFAYLFIVLMLFLRYRQALWRIILPPALASAGAIALTLWLEGGVNMFHLLALLLVLGIGLDMGIFLNESGHRAHTWLAVLLSAATSMLAFGLLTLSNTPVLHHFGLTVLIGLMLTAILAPLVRGGPGADPNKYERYVE